jgi:hypothetical protein
MCNKVENQTALDQDREEHEVILKPRNKIKKHNRKWRGGGLKERKGYVEEGCCKHKKKIKNHPSLVTLKSEFIVIFSLLLSYPPCKTPINFFGLPYLHWNKFVMVLVFYFKQHACG